jgi:anaerobic magnesium-protoporphyrin IX monomethyl ester cyclase
MELMLLKPPSGGLLVRYASDAQRTIVGEALGLASIAANTRAAGISTDYLDAYLEDLTVEATVARILATAPRVLGILVRYPFVRIVREITGRVKAKLPATFIVVGGQYASINARLLLDLLPDADAVCVGDGEHAMVALLSGPGGALGHGVDQIVGRGEPRPAADGPRRRRAVPADDDLDRLHAPDRKYLGLSHRLGYETVGISTSRGCPYRCTFCVPQTYARQATPAPWRARSAGSVFAEIKLHHDRGERLFTFTDEHFLPSRFARNRALELAGLLRAAGLSDIRFMFDCRADSVEGELFAQLQQAGLFRVFIGFETESDRVLDVYRKDATRDLYERALAVLRELQVEVIPGMILFSPVTTIEELGASLRFHARHFASYDEDDYLSILTVVPNTPIARRMSDLGLLDGMADGVFAWRYQDGRVAEAFRRFQDVLAATSPSFHARKDDPAALAALKRRVETKLIAIVDDLARRTPLHAGAC